MMALIALAIAFAFRRLAEVNHVSDADTNASHQGAPPNWNDSGWLSNENKWE